MKYTKDHKSMKYKTIHMIIDWFIPVYLLILILSINIGGIIMIILPKIYTYTVYACIYIYGSVSKPCTPGEHQNSG